MSRQDRTGNRKPRDQRQPYKTPELGYYLIVTDTEATERCFFDGLCESLPENVRDKIVIKVEETKTRKLIDSCESHSAYSAQYCIPWIVFDRDEVQNFDEIIDEAQTRGIHVGWSNPCFEIWMHAYYGKMPVIESSKKCCEEFGRIYYNRTNQKYSKSDRQLYERLIRFGDEEMAIKIADAKAASFKRNGIVQPSKMCPCTTVHQLVRDIRGKTDREGRGN